MQSALHVTTIIQPGNKIELQIPDSSIGDTVEVFVIFANRSTTLPLLHCSGENPIKQRSILTMIDTIHRQQPHRTAEEIEQQIQAARDGWES